MVTPKPIIHETQVPYVEVHGIRQDASTFVMLVGGSPANKP